MVASLFKAQRPVNRKFPTDPPVIHKGHLHVPKKTKDGIACVFAPFHCKNTLIWSNPGPYSSIGHGGVEAGGLQGEGYMNRGSGGPFRKTLWFLL